MNKLNLQDEINRVEKALAIAQKRERDIATKNVNKNEIQEPELSDEDIEPPQQQEETQEETPQKEQVNEEIPDNQDEDIESPSKLERTENVDSDENVKSGKKKKKRKSRRTKKYISESESSESSSDDDQYTIEFVVNRIHDQIKFFQKNIYRLISKYKSQVFDTDEVEQLNEMYADEEEDFHSSYEESINILPIDVDLPEKIYTKFEKELEKITKKWNSFIQRLEIVK